MTRKPLFWIVFILLFSGSIFFVVNYYSKAYPVVNLNLTMNRQAALEQAQQLAKENNWGPSNFEQAATFDLDRKVQTFVELEQGGTEAFSKMIQADLYAPYIWKVRHYKPNVSNETIIRYTPAGKFYGFREKIPEEQAGPSLNSDSALAIATHQAQHNYSINLQTYQLVEKAHQKKPNGRTDHSFVYERKKDTLGLATYRMRLKVSGDKFTELTHYIKIPEAFSRRFSEMRSTNQTIATLANIAMVVIYMLGGCIFGLFVLMQQNWVIWRKALIWGAIVALLQVLAQINQWPLFWMNYDTAVSSQSFVIQQIIQLILIFIFEGLLLSITFMAAESLTRKAFPQHIQLWKIWSPQVANSPAVLGQTVGGYLAVGLFLAFDIGLFFFATKVLGWWVPSDILFEPNSLASYWPWLSPLANALHAGFWEECLFRAVPIAGAALLGQKYGHRKWWIIAAFILQALIFGGAHANYPMQPAYARVVELIIPSLAFGLLYLSFGLLPAIILHYAYDVVLMAMPLFAASSAGIWVDRLLVIVFTLAPLLVVLGRILQARGLTRIPDWAYNSSWQPSVQTSERQIQIEEKEAEYTLTTSKKRHFSIITAGAVGLLVWALTTNFSNRAPRIETSRQEAVEIAHQKLAQKSINLSDSMRVLTSLWIPLSQDDRFVWQSANPQIYDKLLGPYLAPPMWEVRYAQFEGDVASRAEEYRVYIQSGEVTNLNHKLPESAPGAKLEEDSARAIVHTVLQKKYQINPADLKEVVAKPVEQPKRKDWTFQYVDTLNYNLESGEPRIIISLAGNQVVDTYTKVHVPEEWQRQQRAQNTKHQTVMIICGILLFGLLGIAAVIGLIRWSKKDFPVREFIYFLSFLFLLGLIRHINQLPAVMASFNTAQPFQNQLIIMVVAPLIAILLVASALALINGLIKVWKPEQKNKLDLLTIVTSISVGFIMAGITSLLAKYIEPSLKPLWANYSALNNYIPFIATSTNSIQRYVINSTILVLIFSALSRFTNNWTKRRIVFGLLVILLGLIMEGLALKNFTSWLIIGILGGTTYLVLYISIIRYRLETIPLIVATISSLEITKQIIFNAYPSARAGNILEIGLIMGLAFYWSKRLLQRQ